MKIENKLFINKRCNIACLICRQEMKLINNEALTNISPVWTGEDILPYTVGALLYSPAINHKISSKISDGSFGNQYSLALCMEDSISDSSINAAEEQLLITLKQIYELTLIYPKHYIPKIFIRVREPRQLLPMFNKIIKYEKIITGFIFPKYTIPCADDYMNSFLTASSYCSHNIYMMPILESTDVINPAFRATRLNEIKDQLSAYSNHVLNVRVGGNDFCKNFGVRRHFNSTIYEIAAVNNILGDIISVFSDRFIVSGPVFEYFNGTDDSWKQGLIREAKQDMLNGFIGKTIIHPNQIPVINEAFMVDECDYMDALRIYNFDNNKLLVEKSYDGSRMNEVKTHIRWAKRILKLSYVYGVKHDNI